MSLEDHFYLPKEVRKTFIQQNIISHLPPDPEVYNPLTERIEPILNMYAGQDHQVLSILSYAAKQGKLGEYLHSFEHQQKKGSSYIHPALRRYAEGSHQISIKEFFTQCYSTLGIQPEEPQPSSPTYFPLDYADNNIPTEQIIPFDIFTASKPSTTKQAVKINSRIPAQIQREFVNEEIIDILPEDPEVYQILIPHIDPIINHYPGQDQHVLSILAYATKKGQLGEYLTLLEHQNQTSATYIHPALRQYVEESKKISDKQFFTQCYAALGITPELIAESEEGDKYKEINPLTSQSTNLEDQFRIPHGTRRAFIQKAIFDNIPKDREVRHSLTERINSVVNMYPGQDPHILSILSYAATEGKIGEYLTILEHQQQKGATYIHPKLREYAQGTSQISEKKFFIDCYAKLGIEPQTFLELDELVGLPNLGDDEELLSLSPESIVVSSNGVIKSKDNTPAKIKMGGSGTDRTKRSSETILA